jgi:hypothetical protein
MGTTKKTGGKKVKDLNVKSGAKVKGGVRKAGGGQQDF